MIPKMSQFQFYSVGIVAANKKPSSNDIEVIPMEETPMIDGEATDNIDKYTASGESTDGSSFEVEIDNTPSIRATWTPFGNTNRMTSPDVRRGERVAIYRFSDVDQYFWVDMETNRKLRRLETVVFGFSNNREENVPNDASSMYYFEVSTMKKLIHVHTAKNDKEPFEYDVQINTKDGCVTVKDDDGNSMVMDSPEERIELHNKSDSHLKIYKKNIDMVCDERMFLKCKDLIIDASASIDVKTNAYTVKDNSYKHVNTTWKIDVPVAEFTKKVDTGSDMHIGGDNNIDGNNNVGGICSDSRGGHG